MNKIPSSPVQVRCAGFFRYTAITLLLALLVQLSASAQDIISLKFTSPKGATASLPGDNWMFAGDYAGAPGAYTNSWNNMMATSDGSSASILLAAGTISNSAGAILPNLQVQYVSAASKDGVLEWNVGSTNDAKLFGTSPDAYGNSGFSQFGYLDITNIPYTNYNIYVYIFPGNGGTGSANDRGGFCVITNAPTGTNRVYISSQTAAGAYEPNFIGYGNGYVQATTTVIASGGVPWTAIPGGNYAIFNGLTNSYTRLFFSGLGNGSGAKDDLGNYVTGGSGAVRFDFAGIQIVQVNGGMATNLFFNPSNTTLHAGSTAGTQSVLDAQLANGATINVSPSGTYTSDSTNVATVSATGFITPGTNGTAHVIASYQGLLATNTVTVIGPSSLYLSLANTNLLVGNGQGDTTTATLYANFSDAANIPVDSFSYVSFSSTPGGIVSVTSNGVVTAQVVGAFNLTGTYDGFSVTTNDIGVDTAWVNPVSVPAMGVHFTASGESMLFHDLSGYTGARAGYWNNFVQNLGNVTNQLDNPTDDQGDVLSNTVVQMIPDFGGVLFNQSLDNVGGTTPITTNESVLFGELLDFGMNNGTTVASELIVSNVPYASYDVYFYIWNDTGNPNRPAEITIDGNTQYRNNSASYPVQPANNGTGYVIASPQPGSLPASVVNVPFGNVIKFTGVTDSTLSAQIAAVGQDLIIDANTVTRVRLAGFQIVASLDSPATNIYLSPSSVPAQLPGNPATYGLTVLANFINGTTGGNVSDQCAYGSSNPNIFTVDTNGNITAGLTPGTATLTVTFQTNTLAATVTNLAPLSVTVGASPATVYIDSGLGVQPAQATVFATFAGQTNVNISAFNSVSYVDQGSPAATLASNGAITANAQGTASLGASYLGTAYVTPDAFTVSSIYNPPILRHLYNFTNMTQVIDSVGGANGTVYPPGGTNLPITLNGQEAVFPGDAAYNNEPWIALPSGIIDNMGDVTIEMWCGQSQRNVWGRFLGFGDSLKGNDPQNDGGSAPSGLQLLASYAGTGDLDFSGTGNGDMETPYALTNGAEYHIVAVCAPNAGITALYVNGVLITSGSPTAEYLNALVDDTVDWLGVSLSDGDAPLAGWINYLALYDGVMPASQVASDYAAGQSVYLPPVTVSTTPVPVTFSLSSGSLNLTWPTDHLGWRLEVQTNSLSTGLGTNWTSVTGSTTVTNEMIPVNPANGAVFYRLVYP